MRTTEPAGVLVMAHGGSPEWNEAVRRAVSPLAADVPTVIAFGMADPATMAAALDSLRRLGVTRVATVRLFLSGRSFLDETRYLLGLSTIVPAVPGHGGHDGAAPAPLVPLASGLVVTTHEEGVITSPEARGIMVERARALRDPARRESLLLVAHGMGDDAQDADVVQSLRAVAAELAPLGFEAVQVATLREDWPSKRQGAEQVIRDFVGRESAAGRRVIVLPMRLWGFGPYAQVLSGLEYTAGDGLLPHAEVSAWIRRTAARLLCDGTRPPAAPPCSGAGAAASSLR
ncbi:MAG: hypothetical protein HYX65_11880 [Gemmatimonadetes bacterium]|nr:hypothetical protein [Gemmatimonadota bacterium]